MKCSKKTAGRRYGDFINDRKNELFEITHWKKDKSFVDEKSAAIYEAYEAKKLALSQQLEESAIVPDDDDIFLEVVGGPNKGGRVYRLGSQSSSVNNGNSTRGPSCSTLPPQVSIAMMQDFVQQTLNDFGLQNEENLGRHIGKAVSPN